MVTFDGPIFFRYDEVGPVGMGRRFDEEFFAGGSFFGQVFLAVDGPSQDFPRLLADWSRLADGKILTSTNGDAVLPTQ